MKIMLFCAQVFFTYVEFGIAYYMLEFFSYTEFGVATVSRDWLLLLFFCNYLSYEIIKWKVSLNK